jgi:hypothetical protein
MAPSAPAREGAPTARREISFAFGDAFLEGLTDKRSEVQQTPCSNRVWSA